MTLKIYHKPGNKDSKAWYVFNPMAKGWKDGVEYIDNYKPTEGPSLFWGFVGQNYDLVERHKKLGHTWYFSDMPYWGRWNGLFEALDPNYNFYWRIIKNKLHHNTIVQRPSDRFNKLNIEIQDWRPPGEHILVCPSSPTMNRYYGCPNWTNDVVAELKKHTDRPIRVRQKPRRNGTSGPAAALVSLKQDLENCHAIVTSVSMAAIEAAINGVPVFTNEFSPCAPIGLQELSKIEDPIRPSREDWAYSWAYAQFTPKEIESGLAYEILNDSAST